MDVWGVRRVRERRKGEREEQSRERGREESGRAERRGKSGKDYVFLRLFSHKLR